MNGSTAERVKLTLRKKRMEGKGWLENGGVERGKRKRESG